MAKLFGFVALLGQLVGLRADLLKQTFEFAILTCHTQKCDIHVSTTYISLKNVKYTCPLREM